MKAETGQPTPRPSSAKNLPASGLRTGKIHVTRGSAAQIRQKIGVTPADERLAEKALTIAAARPQAKASLARKGGKAVVAAKRVRPATTKNR